MRQEKLGFVEFVKYIRSSSGVVEQAENTNCSK